MNGIGFPSPCNSWRATSLKRSRTHADSASPDSAAASLNPCFSRGSSRTCSNSPLDSSRFFFGLPIRFIP